MKRIILAILTIATPFFLLSCEWLEERDFQVAVHNRTNTKIEIAIDGEWWATVESQNILNFTITKEYEDSQETYRDGTIYTVTTAFAAKSRPNSSATLPHLSKTKRITLTTDRVTNITFDKNDW